mmetsp:Transcript_92290/g.148998  ORF Transcript_92290/g.148998 Transcript_92290/m.148998 type:complete len:435 (+) Transcript_92290:1-1305(+)
MIARRRFGQCGWSTPCTFSHTDFIFCATFLQNHLKDLDTKKRKEIPWETLRNVIVQIMYGAERSDPGDLRLMRTLSEKYIAQVVLETNHQFAVGYSMPACSDLNAFRSSIEAFPVIERPEVTGLSSTSEFIFGLQHAEDVFSKLANTLVGAGSSPDMVSEVQLLSRVEELLQKFPMPFGASEVREALEKDGGANLPTNVAFKHELDVLGKVLTTARHSLQRMHVMLTGNLTPSEELNEAVQDIQLHRVPALWEKLSWQSPNLGHWMQQMAHRMEQWKRWLERGRPFSFWLAGFTNPVGFLSALKQEFSFKQKGWGLENCVFFTEVTKLEASDLKGPAENGAYVHGLYLDGAAWNRKEGKLVDTPPKIANMMLPVMYICVLQKSAKKHDFQVFSCPVYTRKSRGIQNFVFSADLKTEELVTRWILRGVALMCSQD